MTKAKISEYDAVASNNTDVNGVNIAEGCPPSGMNNMGREIMAALKRFQVGSDGDGVTVGGNLVVSGTSTLSTTSISSADINAGTIDATAIGGSTPAAGSFTTLNTSGAVVFNDAGADVDFRVESDTVDHALFVEGSSGNVGIGTSSPASTLHLSSTLPIITLTDTTQTSSSRIYQDEEQLAIDADPANALAGTYIAFRTDNTERMRIDSSGNLLVGMSTSSSSSAGVRALSSGTVTATRDGDTPAVFNRLTNDGAVVEFRKDGTTVGSIQSFAGSRINIGSPSGACGVVFGTSAMVPTNNGALADNTFDIGQLTTRWDDVYATNGTIQTSDRNEKQDIESLSEAETRVAVAAKGLMKKYRWKSAVAEKGDDARIHFGIIAQDLKAAFEAEGLDAGRYAMFIHSAWWETQTEVPAVEAQEAVYETQTDEEGNEVQVLVSEAVEAKEAYTRTDTYETEEEAPEGAVRKERMGIRYNELLAFIIAAL